MIRIYVAGAYSANNVIEVLNNMAKGMWYSTRIALLGCAPFCPWHDYQYIISQNGDNKLSLDWFYKYSIAWLEVSDVMFVVPGYENSKGTLAEIEIARQKGMMIYYDIEELRDNI